MSLLSSFSIAALAASLLAPAPTAVVDTPLATAQDEATAPAELSAEEIAQRVQAYYDAVTDFTADFSQEYRSASLGSTRTSEGRVYFKKPGKMRWDYRGEDERYLISDGTQLWVYEPQFAQYYNQSLADSQLPSALRFLMGEGNLQADFNVRVRSQDGQKIELELAPKVRNSQFARLRFVVDATTFQVMETTVHDALGNTNRLIFKNIRQNAGLPDAGFDFAPPAGARRVEAPEN